MPIYIHLSNLLIPKSVINKYYNGGQEKFRIDYKIGSGLNQEDDELYSISKMNSSEFHLDRLFENGIPLRDNSKLFTIVNRYGGVEWDTGWLVSNSVYAWHIHCHPDLVEEANRRSNLTVDIIGAEMEKGNNLWSSFKYEDL